MPRPPSSLLPSISTEVEVILDEFQRDWELDRDFGYLKRCLERATLEHYPPALLELACHDFELRYSQDRAIRAEIYFKHFSHLLDDAKAAIALIKTEHRCRRKTESRLLRAEYLERFHDLNLGLESHLPELAGTEVSNIVITGYELLDNLGSGSIGVVKKARDLFTDRLVAMKLIEVGSASPEQKSLAVEEAKKIAAVSHPNIIPVFHVGEVPGYLFITLEYAEKGSLEAKYKDSLPSPREAADMVRTLAHALDHAHRRGIVHLDLKPDNVVLTSDDVLKLTDFSLAKFLRDLGKPHSLTAFGGTPGYRAPEQEVGGSAGVSPKTDVYGLGAILHRLLYGRPPGGEGAWKQVFQYLRSQSNSPGQRSPNEVARELNAICRKCLNRDPAQRYESAKDLATDLDRFLNGEPTVARRVRCLARLGMKARKHPKTTAFATVFVLVVLMSWACGWFWFHHDKENALAESRTVAFVEAVKTAQTTEIPGIINEYNDVLASAIPTLLRGSEQVDPTSGVHLRYNLALIRYNPKHAVPNLERHLLAVSPRELRVIRDALAPFRDEVAPRLWAIMTTPGTPRPGRLQAAAVLAASAPNDSRWETACKSLTESLLARSTEEIGEWIQELRPVGDYLIPPLQRMFLDRERSTTERESAFVPLAEFAADRPESLIGLTAVAGPHQMRVLLTALQRHRAKAVPLLQRELSACLAFSDEPPFDRWNSPTPDLHTALNQAHGVLSDRFAYCQTLPLLQWDELADALRRCGYRPKCFRPYDVGDRIAVAAVWARDDIACEWVHGATRGEIGKQDAVLRERGFVPLDVAGYHMRQNPDGQEPRFAALWIKADKTACEASIYTGVSGDEHDVLLKDLEAKGFIPITLTQGSENDQPRYSGVWWRQAGLPIRKHHHVVAQPEPTYERVSVLDLIQTDVRLDQAVLPLGTRQRYLRELEVADQKLRACPCDVVAHLSRINSLFRLGRDDQALQNTAFLLEQQTDLEMTDRVNLLGYRAMIHARQGHAGPARKDLDERRRLAPDSVQAYVEPIVDIYLGNDKEGFQHLESALEKNPTNPAFRFHAARTYAVAARVVQGSPDQAIKARASHYLDRAFELLDRCLTLSSTHRRETLHEADFETIRNDQRFAALRQKFGLDRHYSAVWQDPPVNSREMHGLGSELLRDRGRQWEAEGYRPVAIATCTGPALSPISAAVWHRPALSEIDSEEFVNRRARFALALLHLDRGDLIWPLFQHRADPRLRTQLIHLAGALGIGRQALAERLWTETDASARRAILLALGEYHLDDWTVVERNRLVSRVRGLYDTDPDSGIHSASEWLLRRLEGVVANVHIESNLPVPLLGHGNRNWFINTQGITFSVVNQPVEFWMGSPPHETRRKRTEDLIRKNIPRSYAIATKEITVELFDRFRRAHPEIKIDFERSRNPDPQCPVIEVSWLLAAQFCRWLSDEEKIPEEQMCYPTIEEIERCKTGNVALALQPNYLSRRGYRLPTDAEWEYACRAGSITSRHFGESEETLIQYAWFLRNAKERTAPTGLLKPNDLGLFDMLGNAWEWCDDEVLFDGSRPFRKGGDDLELARTFTSQSNRLLRGGGFASLPDNARSARVHWAHAGTPTDMSGFRIARTLP